MPKLLKTYSNFTGGLNTVDNDRTLNDNELASLKDAVIDRRGFIVSSGRFADNTSDYRAPTIDASQAGYGLFQYRSDYDQAGNNESIVRTLLADADDGGQVEISVYSSDTNTWSDAQISLGAVTGSGSTDQGRVIYHIAGGDVRICDTNITNTGTDVKRYGYVSAQGRWKDSSGSVQTPGSYAGALGWISSKVNLAKPDKGLVGITIGGNEDTDASSSNATTLISDSSSFPASMDTDLDSGTGSSVNDYWGVNRTNGLFAAITDSSSTADTTLTTATISGSGTWLGNKVFSIYPPAGRGLNLNVVASSGGSWAAGDYEFGITFVYEGNQESLIYQLKGDAVTVSANQKLTCTILATQYKDQGSGAVEYDRRITGGRVYTRISGSDDAWVLFSDVSFTLGARPSLEGGYTYWTEEYSDAPFLYSSFVSSSLNLDTYESINGFSPDSAFIALQGGEKYKTSVVTNRRAFIGNVYYRDSENKVASRGDTIRYSQVNKFDTFPEFNFIDIGVNDGEEFIKLEAYADRLLAFKEKTLYIINIGGGSDTQWFLESEHKNMGVGFHAATVKTDFGIAWVNKNGLFFYDGSQIRNLQTKIHQTEDAGEINSWNNFVNKTYIDTMIGYEPKRKHLIIIRNAGSAQYDGNSGDAFIYSFETNTFSFVENFAPDAVKTNMITDAYNNLSVGTALDEIETYNGTPAASLSGGGFGITLKNDDFGLPGVVKKVYGMTIEYSSSHTSGSTSFKYYHTDSAGTKQGIASAFTPPATAGDLDVFQQEFKNSGNLAPISSSSFQPYFSCHNLDGIHKVHSVTVEYRPIRKRIT
jgi:hypothetical protein|tara:strand:- start:2736 stop:5183 length:2448 start_codon:yes stop_codon:yes gene_type:complete